MAKKESAEKAVRDIRRKTRRPGPTSSDVPPKGSRSARSPAPSSAISHASYSLCSEALDKQESFQGVSRSRLFLGDLILALSGTSWHLVAQEPTTRCRWWGDGAGNHKQYLVGGSRIPGILLPDPEKNYQRQTPQRGGVEVSEGASTNTYLKGGAARAAARAQPRGAQEGNEAASLHPLDLVLEACAT